MTPSLAIDLAQIRPNGFGVNKFHVQGHQTLDQLRPQDSLASLQLDVQARAFHNTAQNEVVILLNATMRVVNGDASATDTSGIFELQFFFIVDNLPDLLVPAVAPQPPTMHPQLVLILTGIAYSTARGILWTRLLGTALEGATLPIIDPRRLFDAPFVPPVLDSAGESTAPPTPRKVRAQKK